MASIPCALMMLLICQSQVHMGVQGGDTITVFSNASGTATLPCANVLYSNCSSTTWIYSSIGASVELFRHGEMEPESAKNRSERLSLSHNCSLHITDISTEDRGLYTCQQYPEVGGNKSKVDAQVYLTVLHVSASPRETEMEAGSHVTLHCLLHTHDNCTYSVRDEGLSLSWVNKSGSELKNNSNRLINTTSICSTTLTEKLRHPKSASTQRKCQLTAGGKVQTSETYSIRVKAPSSTPKSGTSGASPDSSGVHVAVKVAITISLFVAIIIVAVIHRKRSGDPKGKPKTSAHSVRSAATSQCL